MAIPMVRVPSFIAVDYNLVTPSNTVQQSFTSLYIGGAGAGNLRIVPPGKLPAQAVAFPSVGVGFFSVSGDYVMATGTDVTEIIALR